MCLRRRASPRSRRSSAFTADDSGEAGCAVIRSRHSTAATTLRCRCLPAITSPTTPAPASCTPRPATAARTSMSGPRTRAKLAARGINTTIPYTVDADGRFTEQAPGFTGKRVLTDKGEKGDANEAVIKALIDAGMLIARGRLKHQYPHSWRSKKPVIFRNTPQWFIAMDKHIAGRADDTLRHRALDGDQGHALGAGAGREPHQRHDREPARLGDLAPARLGRADHGVRAREGRRLGRNPRRSNGECAHRRRLRAGRRRRLVRARRARAFPRLARQRGLAEGRRHSRRLVRFRLDACLRAGRPEAFSRRSPASSARPTAARDA